MNLTVKVSKNILFLILISLLFCFSACKMKAEQKSLTDQFVLIDALINQGQVDSAVEELESARKRANEKWSYLGVYKRYLLLGEDKLAEEVLKEALKKDNYESAELRAVYTSSLMDKNQNLAACVMASTLVDTPYASLLSEIILSENKIEAIKQNAKDLSSIYYNAYVSSKNPVWLRNCVIAEMSNGNYGSGAELVPDSYADVDDAFFWGLVLYDSGKYYESIEAVELSKQLMEDLGSPDSYKTSFIDQIALLSDAYMNVSDIENAELARQELVSVLGNLKDLKGPVFIEKLERKLGKNSDLLPIILTNSALWAYNQNKDDQCADLLFYVVNKWPDFVPGLVLYADFAYNSNLERKESKEMMALRDAGLASVEMEKYDNRRKIPLSDAEYRVSEAVKRTNDPYLRIVQLDLKYKTNPNITKEEKNRDLWNMLESSNTLSSKNVEENIGEKVQQGDNVLYKTLLVEYGLNSLLLNKQYDDAYELFQNYIISQPNYDPDEKFWDCFISNIRDYDLGIVEFGGYFAAHYKNKADAIRIHEYCVYESGGLLEEGLISQNVSTATCMNLGDIYYSIGQKGKALDLYGRIGGRESKKSLRSEIFYRIANIYTASGDIKNALRSAEYACELYPENVKASLLKDNLRNSY